MRSKFKQINKYLVYDIFGMVIYGLILYFGFVLLAGHSLFYAYIWNFTLIFLVIILDGYAVKIMQSDEVIGLLMKKFNAEKVHRMIAGGFITFKTLLYLFYIFILVASEIINFYPTMVNENLVNFIQANNYSIVFLLAFDSLIAQFTKDKERMIKISDRIKNFSVENKDK